MATAASLTASADDLDLALQAAPHRIGEVALIVRDIEAVSGFYRSVLGLQVVESGRGKIRLGAGGSVLLELRHDPDARLHSRREAGLFHTAFLLPGREELGAWLAFAARQGVQLTGAADHLVSEAVYLTDPEGNGIEIYVDRPRAAWRRTGGMIEMTSDPLDLNDLMAAARTRAWSAFPEDGVIGHVHLQVGDIAAAEAFYGDVLGFDITCRYRGASFYGSGGYHHQLATNVWNSRGAAERAGRTTGLGELELVVDHEVLETVRARTPSGMREAAPSGLSVQDPWGTLITLRSG